jgi:AcrR family transcriptional regulator
MTGPRTRLAPAQRREQLVELGAELLAGRRLEELSIDEIAEEAGISRGLLYHYFSGKREFHLAVLQRMVDRVIATTAPSGRGEPLDQLVGSLEAYVAFVRENHEAYTSFVRAAAAGDADYQRLHDDARAALTDRIFVTADAEALTALGLEDTPAVRLMVRGWSAMVEDVVLSWLDDDSGVARSELLDMLARSLASVGSIVSSTR